MSSADRPPAVWGLRARLVSALVALVLITLVSASLVLQWRAGIRHEHDETQRWQARAGDLSALSTQLLWNATMPGEKGPQVPNAARFAVAERALRSALARTPGLHSIQIFIFHPGVQEASVGLELGQVPEAPQPGQVARQRLEIHPVNMEGLRAIDVPLRPLGNFNPNARALVQRIWVRPRAWYAHLDWETPAIFSLAIAIVLVTLAGISLELWIHKPLRAIQAGFNRVAQGQLAVDLDLQGAPEFQHIAGEFNQMSRSLDQQRQLIAEQGQAMARSDRLAALGRLSAGLAHEIGNPLSAMLGYTQLLADPRSRTMEHEQREELLERIAAQIERIKKLVSELGDFVRPTERKADTVDVGARAQACTELLSGDPRLRGVTFDVELDSAETGVLEVETVPQVLEQILLNLVVNAGLAAQEGSGRKEVNLSVRRTEDHNALDILIRDTGQGIDEKLASRIFDPFFTTRPPGQGTGLGLAISSELCRGLGGQLDLLTAHDPQHDDSFAGAQFRIRLPVDAPPLSMSASIPAVDAA